MDAEEDHSGQPAIGEDLSLKERHYTKRGVEVYSMWFEKNKIDIDTFIDYVFCHRKHKPSPYNIHHETFRTIIEKDPAMFKGRIFLSDAYHFHEIYNSKLLDDLYVDLPMENKLEDCNISGPTDLLGTNEEEQQVQDDDDDTTKKYSNGNSVFSGHTDHLLGTNEEEQVRDDDTTNGDLKNNSNNGVNSVFSGHTDLAPRSPKNDAQRQVPERTYLPMMGPHARIHLFGDIMVTLHRDSGNAHVDASYEDIAAPLYSQRRPIQFDDDGSWHYRGEESFQLKVEGLYHSLILDCRMFSDSKSVHVEVYWVMTDDENNNTNNANYDDDSAIYICGELSVISDGRTSLLFKTPPNKAKRVSLGQSIPLLKSVFVVQYYADFEFCANLGCRPDNVKAEVSLNFPSVKDSVLFPNSESCEAEVYTHQDAPGVNCHLYETTHIIAGSGGYLKVTATIDIK